MKSLSEYVYKQVLIITKDGRSLEGNCSSFTSDVESDSGYEEISIDYPEYIEVVSENEIKEIKVIA